jgi:hypothetical protein
VMKTRFATLAILAGLGLTACGGGGQQSAGNSSTNVGGDPYGATGAPGADMTDKGTTDGASGLADSNATTGNSAGQGNSH